MPDYSQKHQSTERSQIKCITVLFHVAESDEEKNHLEASHAEY